MDHSNKTTRQLVEYLANKVEVMDERQEKLKERADATFNKLFVQNGHNNGQDCLAVQIQKNTGFRHRIESSKKEERRSKWGRRGFYLSLVGIALTNVFILIKLFI
jgi:hypothetical protein